MKPSTWCEMVLTARKMAEEGRFPMIDSKAVEEEAKKAIRERTEG